MAHGYLLFDSSARRYTCALCLWEHLVAISLCKTLSDASFWICVASCMMVGNFLCMVCCRDGLLKWLENSGILLQVAMRSTDLVSQSSDQETTVRALTNILRVRFAYLASRWLFPHFVWLHATPWFQAFKLESLPIWKGESSEATYTAHILLPITTFFLTCWLCHWYRCFGTVKCCTRNFSVPKYETFFLSIFSS